MGNVLAETGHASAQDPFPSGSFRTDRCNMCIEIFRKVIYEGSRAKYCAKNGVKDELCRQVETAVKTFLNSNGSPGIWRHIIGGINRATKKSFEQMFGAGKGVQAQRRQEFEQRCAQWPSESGRRRCLAQAFCLYSGGACHAKIQTEDEATAEAIKLIDDDASADVMDDVIDGPEVGSPDVYGDNSGKDGSPTTTTPPSSTTTPPPSTTTTSATSPKESVPNKISQAVVWRVLTGKDRSKMWLKWPVSYALN